MHVQLARFFPVSTPVALLAAALVALPLAAQESASAPSPPGDTPAADTSTRDLLDLIQRECLRAYPRDLLAKMASGAEEIPEDVESDPKAQMQFLDREEPLEKGLFYPSLLEELLPPLQTFVSDGTRFLDLGSGDGRAVFLAAALGAEATGIEYDGEMVEVSQRALDALKGEIDPGKVHIIQGDFFKSSWAEYDLIYYFDQSSFEQERVREKLAREVPPEARLIVGHEQAPFPGFVLETTFGRHPRHPDMRIYRRVSENAKETAAQR